ncbi:hypothetical protein Tco_0873422 [Tanacetum coccineum]|uniref:Retrovirus-related Pol polyprotein from transposon TNT 1-94 n=1 Tax=Tanacetum coccineum TaxID=301880 RepID=A0ABQ5BLY5_9ASTR
MAAVEVPQILEYRSGKLNAAPILEVENFTHWKKRFMCHIISIEPQFENFIKNVPFILMVVGQRKLEGQWTADERKVDKLDQRLKSLIMSVLPDDQINSVINFLTAKSKWDDLILYHEVPSDVKESRVMDLKLCYNTFKFKEGESLTQTFTRYKALMNKNTNHVKDSNLASLFGKLKYEENLIDNIYETEKNKSLVSTTPLLTAFFSTSIVEDFQDSPDDEEDTRSSHEYLNDLEEEYQERALLAKSKRFFKKGTQRFSSAKATDQTECHKCGKNDEEEVSSDDNEMVEVKVLMALAEYNDAVSKKGAKNDERVKISMRKVHTLLEMEDNDDRKTYLDYLCIDLYYDEEQRNNLLSKHKDLVHELNACKEQLLVLKQAKLDFLTMQHINTEILKENKNLRTELKELTSITETWLNNSNKTLAVQSLRFNLPNYDTGRILPAESQRNITDPSVAVTDSLVTEYDSVDESSVKSTFKAKTLKGSIINKPSSAPDKGNKNSSASVVNSAPAGKLKSVKNEDDPPLAILLVLCSIFLKQLAINSGVVSPLATRKVHVHAMNGFEMPLPVAVCSGLVNPLAPRKAPSPSVIHPRLLTLQTSLLPNTSYVAYATSKGNRSPIEFFKILQFVESKLPVICLSMPLSNIPQSTMFFIDVPAHRKREISFFLGTQAFTRHWSALVDL